MSQSASYPISQFLTGFMHDHGYSPVEFIRSLGYRNIERGLRRLEPWLKQGHGYERIFKQICAAYPNEVHDLENAVAETVTVKAAEREAATLESCRAQEATFVPFVHVQGETTLPTGITMFGVSGGKWNLIEIPQTILDLPLDEQLAALPDLMQVYLDKYHGTCPFFGAVTAFRFVRLIDYFQFDKGGVLVRYIDKPFRRGVASVPLR
jgi:hypothetical protein